MNPHNTRLWTGTEAASLLKGFWATVKSKLQLRYGIKKVFMTGVTPLCLADMTSGFNVAMNMSFRPRYSTLCGFTQSDVLEALRLVCQDEKKAHDCLEELTYYANGYHFSRKPVESVFNPQTVLAYLQVCKGYQHLDQMLIIGYQGGHGRRFSQHCESSRLGSVGTFPAGLCWCTCGCAGYAISSSRRRRWPLQEDAIR